MERIPGNQFIAEYLGFEKDGLKWKAANAYNVVKDFMGGVLDEYYLETLPFDSDWNWLCMAAKYCIDQYPDMREGIFQALHDVDKKVLWDAIIVFIRWWYMNITIVAKWDKNKQRFIS